MGLPAHRRARRAPIPGRWHPWPLSPPVLATSHLRHPSPWCHALPLVTSGPLCQPSTRLSVGSDASQDQSSPLGFRSSSTRPLIEAVGPCSGVRCASPGPLGSRSSRLVPGLIQALLTPTQARSAGRPSPPGTEPCPTLLAGWIGFGLPVCLFLLSLRLTPFSPSELAWSGEFTLPVPSPAHAPLCGLNYLICNISSPLPFISLQTPRPVKINMYF